MKTLLADIKIAPDGGFKGFGILGNPGGNAVGIFSNLLSSIIGLMTVIAIIWFVFILFIGAFGIMTAGGDKQAAESARKKIGTGLVGLIIVISALFLVNFIGGLLGIPDALNLKRLIDTIMFGSDALLDPGWSGTPTH